jgi:hypothetical protein
MRLSLFSGRRQVFPFGTIDYFRWNNRITCQIDIKCQYRYSREEDWEVDSSLWFVKSFVLRRFLASFWGLWTWFRRAHFGTFYHKKDNRVIRAKDLAASLSVQPPYQTIIYVKWSKYFGSSSFGPVDVTDKRPKSVSSSKKSSTRVTVTYGWQRVLRNNFAGTIRESDLIIRRQQISNWLNKKCKAVASSN